MNTGARHKVTKLDSTGVITGLVFIGFGVMGWVLAGELTVGTSARMGPGYFPRMVSAALAGLGVVRLAIALARPGGPGESLREGLYVRPLAFTIMAVLTFAFVDTLGLVAAVSAVVFVSALAAPPLKPLETAAIAAVLSGFAWLVFVKLLGLALPVWPGGM